MGRPGLSGVSPPGPSKPMSGPMAAHSGSLTGSSQSDGTIDFSKIPFMDTIHGRHGWIRKSGYNRVYPSRAAPSLALGTDMRRTIWRSISGALVLYALLSLPQRAGAQFPTPGPTPTPPPTPTATPGASPMPTEFPTPGPTPTETPVTSSTPTATFTPMPIPTATATPAPSPQPPEPSTPTPTVSSVPSATPGGEAAPPPPPASNPESGGGNPPLGATGRLPETGWGLLGPAAAGSLALLAFLIARRRRQR